MGRIGRCRYDNLFFDHMTANEHASVSRVADREKLSLLLDKARLFAGKNCKDGNPYFKQNPHGKFPPKTTRHLNKSPGRQRRRRKQKEAKDCVGQRFCLGSGTNSLNTNSKSTFKAPNGAV